MVFIFLWLILLSIILRSSIYLIANGKISSFWCLSNTPLCSLSILQLMDIGALSIVWLCWLCCYKHQGCMCPFESAFLYPLCKYLVVQLLACRGVLLLTFEEPPYYTPEWLYQFVFPPTVHEEGSPFSESLPTLGVSSIVTFSHSDRGEVIPHCTCDLHFPDTK